MWNNSSSQNNNSIFGSSFNQNMNNSSNSGGIFGNINSQSNLGTAQSSGSSIFGNTNQNQQNSIFGSKNTSSIFSGIASSSSSSIGTGYTKFNTTTIRETSSKGGIQRVSNNRSHVIISLVEFKEKTLMQLRIEDYSKNLRKKFQVNMNNQDKSNIFNSSTQNKNIGFSFGNSNNNTSFGSSNLNSSSSLFGQNQNTNSGGLFATNQNLNNSSNIFGNIKSNNESKPSLFGSSSSNSNNQGKSVFSFGNSNSLMSNKDLNSSGSSSLFGPKTNNLTNQNSIFGTSNNSNLLNTSSGGLFNKSATTSGTTFGQLNSNATNNPSSGSTGSLFGSSGSSLFGNTSNNNTTNLPKTGSSLFGFSTSNTPTTGSGLNSQQSTGSSLFGTNNNNNNTTTSSTFGNTLFGNNFSKQSSSGSLFGSNKFSLNNSSNNFGQSNVNSSTMGANIPENSKNLDVRKSILTTSPYNKIRMKNGNINSVPLAEDPFANASSEIDNMKKIVLKSMKKNNICPEFISGVKLTPISAQKDFKKEQSPSTHRKYLESSKKKSNLSMTLNSSMLNDNSLKICQSQNLSIDYQNEIIKSIFFDTTATLNMTSEVVEPLNANSFLDKEVHEQQHQHNENFDIINPNSFIADNNTKNQLSLANVENSQEHESIHPAGIISTRPDYFTIPTSEELADLVDEYGKCWVNNFVIGREGYGCLRYQGIMDITDINIDNDVHFKKRSVSVYPCIETKPPIGEKLNRDCIVELHNIFPSRQSNNRIMIKLNNNDKYKFENKLQKMCDNMDAKFISYDDLKGIWSFSVSHFSVYGFDDNEIAESDDFDISLTTTNCADNNTKDSSMNRVSKQIIYGYDSPVTASASSSSYSDNSDSFSKNIDEIKNDQNSTQSFSMESNLDDEKVIDNLQDEKSFFDKLSNIIILKNQKFQKLNIDVVEDKILLNHDFLTKIFDFNFLNFLENDRYVDELANLKSLLFQFAKPQSLNLISIIDMYVILYGSLDETYSMLENYLYELNFEIIDDLDAEEFEKKSLDFKIITLCSIGKFDTAASIIANTLENRPLALLFLSIAKIDPDPDDVVMLQKSLEKCETSEKISSNSLNQSILSLICGQINKVDLTDLYWSQILILFLNFKKLHSKSKLEIISEFLEAMDLQNIKAYALPQYDKSINNCHDNIELEDFRVTLLRLKVGNIEKLPINSFNFQNFSCHSIIGSFGTLLFSLIFDAKFIINDIILQIAHIFEKASDIEMASHIYLLYLNFANKNGNIDSKLIDENIYHLLIDFIVRNQTYFHLKELNIKDAFSTMYKHFLSKISSYDLYFQNNYHPLASCKTFEDFTFQVNHDINKIFDNKFENIANETKEYLSFLADFISKFSSNKSYALSRNFVQDLSEIFEYSILENNDDQEMNNKLSSVITKIRNQKYISFINKEHLINFLINKQYCT